jgi:hypothetical protein
VGWGGSVGVEGVGVGVEKGCKREYLREKKNNKKIPGNFIKIKKKIST